MDRESNRLSSINADRASRKLHVFDTRRFISVWETESMLNERSTIMKKILGLLLLAGLLVGAMATAVLAATHPLCHSVILYHYVDIYYTFPFLLLHPSHNLFSVKVR